MKTSGQDIAEYFSRVPFGWPADLLRYVAAAMFVDAKLSAIDKAGKRYDNPRAPGVRGLFGTASFKTVRLEVEEESLTPAESAQAQMLLSSLGQPPADGGEVALKEAALLLCTRWTGRLAVLQKAQEVDLPLPTIYVGSAPMLDEISNGAPG